MSWSQLEVELHSPKAITAEDASAAASRAPPPLVVASLSLKTHASAKVRLCDACRLQCPEQCAVAARVHGLHLRCTYCRVRMQRAVGKLAEGASEISWACTAGHS